MQRVLILILIISHPLVLSATEHLKELKASFPEALLTDDYGILTKEDLRINSCIANPSPFSENTTTSYPFWQCFLLSNTQMTCEGHKYDSDSRTRVSLLVISAKRDGESHEFISQRTLPVESCQLFLNDWNNFIKSEKYVCVSGSFISKKVTNGQTLFSWLFGRYKTLRGCDSYFEGECSLAYQMERHRCE